MKKRKLFFNMCYRGIDGYKTLVHTGALSPVCIKVYIEPINSSIVPRENATNLKSQQIQGNHTRDYISDMLVFFIAQI